MSEVKLEFNEVKESFIEWVDEDGAEQCWYYGNTNDDADELLYDASHMICFGDCSGATLKRIVIQGDDVEYVGWQPGMVFEFEDVKTKEIIWTGCFPGWDH